MFSRDAIASATASANVEWKLYASSTNLLPGQFLGKSIKPISRIESPWRVKTWILSGRSLTPEQNPKGVVDAARRDATPRLLFCQSCSALLRAILCGIYDLLAEECDGLLMPLFEDQLVHAKKSGAHPLTSNFYRERRFGHIYLSSRELDVGVNHETGSRQDRYAFHFLGVSRCTIVIPE